MLVLSRKVNQTLVMGEITVTVTRIEGNRVLIGVQAPDEVRVMRGELKPDSVRKVKLKEVGRAPCSSPT